MRNDFVQNISNEEVAALPSVRFGGHTVVVDDVGAIDAACEDLARAGIIGFDTETRPTFRPGALNKVALLQLSTRDTCYLFRLCRIPLDRAIIRVLESKTVEKIGADIGNDLKALQQLRHFKPGGFTDLQGIAPQWGIAEKSVRKLSAITLGRRVSKAQRLSNWEAASLTEAQQSYAATDAWVCLEIYGRLTATDKKELRLPAKETAVADKPKRTPGREHSSAKAKGGGGRRKPAAKAKEPEKSSPAAKERPAPAVAEEKPRKVSWLKRIYSKGRDKADPRSRKDE